MKKIHHGPDFLQKLSLKASNKNKGVESPSPTGSSHNIPAEIIFCSKKKTLIHQPPRVVCRSAASQEEEFDELIRLLDENGLVVCVCVCVFGGLLGTTKAI